MHTFAYLDEYGNFMIFSAFPASFGKVWTMCLTVFQGLLALEGELTPILVQMVKSANTNGLLDNDSDGAKYQNT